MAKSVMTVGNGETTPKTKKKAGDSGKFRVVLVRAGVDPRAFALPEGEETTVETLAQEADATLAKHIITVGRNRVDSNYVLRPGDVVFLVPEPKNA